MGSSDIRNSTATARQDIAQEQRQDGTRQLGEHLDVVVVHHRTPAELLDTAMSRLALAAPGARVVLVDTAGEPAVEPGPNWPRRLEIVRAENRSYSHAVNLGAGLTDAPRLVVMNADVVVEQDTFERLTAAMAADPDTAVVGPLPLTTAGRPQDLGLPYRLTYGRAQRAGAEGAVAPWLSGCLQLIERDTFDKLGGYDETLRFCNEDLEFCLRLRRSGKRCRLVAAPVVHVGGISTPDHPAFHVEGRRGGYVLTQRYRSPVYAFLHRGFLRAESLIGIGLAGDEPQRARHVAMQRLLASGDWQRSPFGATLDDR